MLDMQAVSKVYRTELVETHALRSLDLHVREGEFVAVTGPSGSGKTTFLNIAGLLETYTGGKYILDGEDVSGMSDDARSRLRNQKIGFIFQSFNLIPDLNLFDNADVPLRYRGMPAAERKLRIEDALAQVGLGSRMKHYPAELSGGQQQRAAIARALIHDPKLILMDEPFGALDALTREKMNLELLRIWRDQPPSRMDFFAADEVFPAASHQYILYGMGFPPPPENAIHTAPERLQPALGQVEQRVRALTASLPTNRAYLSALRAESVAARASETV